MSTLFNDSLESLLTAVNNVSNSTKKDSTVRDVLKIIPIIENSQFEFGDSADCSIILDASMVSAAFKFYKSRMCTNTLPFERLDAYNDTWKNTYALIKTTDSPTSLNNRTEVEKSSPMHANETRNLVSSWPDLYDLFEGEAQKVDITKYDDDILIIDQTNALDDELNNTSPLNLNLIDYHNPGNSTKADYEVWRKDVDNHFQNYSAKIEKQNLISVSKDSVKESSSNNFEEQNSTNSLNFNENYFCDELDYEPSENGEIEESVNEDETYAESFLEVEECESLSDYFLVDEISEDNSVGDNQSTDSTNTEFLNTFSGVDDKLCGLRIGSKRSIESLEDDTDEDDHSFKRVSDKKTKGEILNNFDAPETSLNKLKTTKEIELHIQEQCALGNLNEAICTAKKFIPIRGKTAREKIFKELFIDLMKFITDPNNSLENCICLKAIEDTINICLDFKIYSLCSFIIIRCFKCDISISNGKNMVVFCQKMNIRIHSKAIACYADFIKSDKISLPETISFLEYVKNICKISSPKTLLDEILEHFSTGEGILLCTEFYKLCKFLCCIESSEVDKDYLQNFIMYCLQNNCWEQIADFFLAWINKSYLLDCLIQAFFFNFESIGLFYEKFAEELFKHADTLPSNSINVLGQMGSSLMLDAFSRQQYSNAFEMLFTLHKFDINYFELQEPLYCVNSYMKGTEKLVKVLVFPFTIAFAALDICLHLKRPKDAYKVFQSFSWKIPEDLQEKSKIRNQQFCYLLELTKQLHFVESLGIGSVALSDLFLRTNEFSLEELNGFAAGIQAIYNKYLISFINARQLPYVLQFYHYSEGSKKDIFIINHQVLRGLVVYFAQNNLLNDARKLFSIGCTRKVYDIEQEDEFVWNLLVMTSWTMFEVNCAVETFIKLIMKALNDECKTNFCEKSVMTIIFKESENNDSEIDCLNVYPRNIKSMKEITCNILKSMQVAWIECKNPTSLVLIFEKMYNYYEKTSDLKKNLVMKKDILQSKTEFSSSVKESNENLLVQYSALKAPSDSLMSEYPVADSSCVSSPKLITEKSTYEKSFDSAISGNLCLGNSVPVFLESIKPFPSKKIHLSSHFLTPEQEQEVTSSDQIISRSSCVQIFPEKEIVGVNTQMSSEEMHSASTDKFTPKNDNNSIFQKKVSIVSKSKILKKYKKLNYLKNIKFTTHKTIFSKKYKGRNKIYFKKDAMSSYNETISVPLTSKDVKPSTVLEPIKKLSPSIFKNTGKYKITLASSAQNVGHILASVTKLDSKKPADVPEAVFGKISLFLKSKVMLKCKDLNPLQQKDKADQLALAFVKTNTVNALDKKTMKLLNEYAENCIY